MNYDKKFILDSINVLGRKYGSHEAFRDVVTCCAYSFANSVDFKEYREKEYLRIISRYSDEDQELFPKILTALVEEYEKAEEPIDILGDIYEQLNLIKKGNAQFFTPLGVCKVMAKITIDKDGSKKAIQKNGYVSVSDPCVGSGRNLYAVYEELLYHGINPNQILLVGGDIDLTCCCMAYLQLSLMGASAIIHHQDSLTMNRFDTFYTVAYLMNKELQDKLSNKSETWKSLPCHVERRIQNASIISN